MWVTNIVETRGFQQRKEAKGCGQNGEGGDSSCDDDRILSQDTTQEMAEKVSPFTRRNSGKEEAVPALVSLKYCLSLNLRDYQFLV